MSSTSDKKSKFFFANCLHCDGIIRIPIAIRPSSYVACPHCGNRSQLLDLMDQIPEGEVIEGQGRASNGSPEDEYELTEPTTQQKNGKFIVPAQLAAGIKKRRRRRRNSSGSGGSERSSSSTSGRRLPSSESRVTHPSANRPATPTPTPTKSLSEAEENRQARKEEQAQRRRAEFEQKREAAATRDTAPVKPSRSRPPKEKRSPVLETLKIVIGGMFAAPIAYLLLLWVFSRDPLSLAPTIHSVAPLLVPEWVIGDDEHLEPESPGAETTFAEQAREGEADNFFKNFDSKSSHNEFGDSFSDPDPNGINFDETVFD